MADLELSVKIAPEVEGDEAQFIRIEKEYVWITYNKKATCFTHPQFEEMVGVYSHYKQVEKLTNERLAP